MTFMREGKTYSLPLGEREVVEGNIDIFVGSLIRNERRIHFNHKPLTSIPQIRFKPKPINYQPQINKSRVRLKLAPLEEKHKPEVLVGDGFLKSVVETHDM